MEILSNSVEEKILKLHIEAQKSKDAAMIKIEEAVKHLVEAGRELNKVKAEKRGDFVLWLEGFVNYCESTEKFPSTWKFSKSTAYNYMKAAKLCDEKPELTFKTVKDLYIAAEIMPAPEQCHNEEKGPPPVFNIKFSFQPLEKWCEIEKREFLERAKPVVELYNSLVA